MDNPNVAIINFLSDGPGGLDCEMWGNNGDDRVPVIVNDYNEDHTFGGWFDIIYSSPWYLILDENFVYQFKTQSEPEAKAFLEEMLTD